MVIYDQSYSIVLHLKQDKIVGQHWLLPESHDYRVCTKTKTSSQKWPFRFCYLSMIS